MTSTKINVLSGTRINRLGGGYFSVVVDATDPEAIRSKYGLMPGAKIQSFDISFEVTSKKGSEGVLTGYEYEYNVFQPDLGEIKDSMIAKAIMTYVMDDNFQSALNKSLTEFEVKSGE